MGLGFRWAIVLALQLLAMAALSFAVAVLPLYAPGAWLGPALRYGAMVPLGGASAYLAVRKGLNHYAAWFAPPVMYAAVPWTLIGYPPAIGPMFASALVAVACAAAGDVKNRWDDR
ncbi:MAG: hypothetical protein GX558_01175 [Clostridiales bacterium]|nr:hypothetical protein [Clostridiales bacterium]